MVMMKQKKNRHIVANRCLWKGLFTPNGTECDIISSEWEKFQLYSYRENAEENAILFFYLITF